MSYLLSSLAVSSRSAGEKLRKSGYYDVNCFVCQRFPDVPRRTSSFIPFCGGRHIGELKAEMWKERVRLAEKAPASASPLPFDGVSAASSGAFSLISLEGKQIS